MTLPASLQLAQDCETPIHFQKAGDFSWRYAYARSADTILAKDVGQDALALRYNDASFVFTLCDGVSQSFYGDLASRLLSTSLVTWLWNELTEEEPPEVLLKRLKEFLQNLTIRANKIVQNQKIPNGIPTMLQEVLEQKRALGSESTFVAGRVDLPSCEFPAGRVVLTWMGDSRLRIWGSSAERSKDLGNTFITNQRWSTRLGPVNGEPNLSVTPLKVGTEPGFSRILAYSDGLATLDTISQPLTNDALQKIITRTSELPTSDDVSFLELWLGKAPTKITEDVTPPTMVGNNNRVEENQDRISNSLHSFQRPELRFILAILLILLVEIVSFGLLLYMYLFN